MASDASSFADEILIPGFVVRIDDIGNAVGRHLQRLSTQTLVTFADDAIDAAVSARRDNLGDSRLFWHNRLGVEHPIGTFLPATFVDGDAGSLPGLLGTPVEQLPCRALTSLAGKDAVAIFALEVLGRVAEATNLVPPHFTRGEHGRIQVD